MERTERATLEEGEEVIEEGEQKDGIAADFALIAAAQKVEHYEISAVEVIIFRATPHRSR